jgi:hypothetical protein
VATFLLLLVGGVVGDYDCKESYGQRSYISDLACQGSSCGQCGVNRIGTAEQTCFECYPQNRNGGESACQGHNDNYRGHYCADSADRTDLPLNAPKPTPPPTPPPTTTTQDPCGNGGSGTQDPCGIPDACPCPGFLKCEDNKCVKRDECVFFANANDMGDGGGCAAQYHSDEGVPLSLSLSLSLSLTPPRTCLTILPTLRSLHSLSDAHR